MSAIVVVLGAAGAAACVAALLLVAGRYRQANEVCRARLLWLAWAAVVTATLGLLGLAAHILVDRPDVWFAGFGTGVLAFPLALALGRIPSLAPRVRAVLVHTVVNAGLVLLVAAVYRSAVVGLGRKPEPGERALLWLSVGAAVLAGPARRRLEEAANLRVYGERHSPDEALRTFGGRMSRSVPMDELLLQLVEILRKTMHFDSAEVYTGGNGRLSLAVGGFRGRARPGAGGRGAAGGHPGPGPGQRPAPALDPATARGARRPPRALRHGRPSRPAAGHDRGHPGARARRVQR